MHHSLLIRKRRGRLLVSVISVGGFLLATGSAGLLSGCGDDGKMTMVEEKEKPAEIAKGSMDFYKSQHLDKGGRGKR
jgi:hypothetical protein